MTHLSVTNPMSQSQPSDYGTKLEACFTSKWVLVALSIIGLVGIGTGIVGLFAAQNPLHGFLAHLNSLGNMGAGGSGACMISGAFLLVSTLAIALCSCKKAPINTSYQRTKESSPPTSTESVSSEESKSSETKSNLEQLDVTKLSSVEWEQMSQETIQELFSTQSKEEQEISQERLNALDDPSFLYVVKKLPATQLTHLVHNDNINKLPWHELHVETIRAIFDDETNENVEIIENKFRSLDTPYNSIVINALTDIQLNWLIDADKINDLPWKDMSDQAIKAIFPSTRQHVTSVRARIQALSDENYQIIKSKYILTDEQKNYRPL